MKVKKMIRVCIFILGMSGKNTDIYNLFGLASFHHIEIMHLGIKCTRQMNISLDFRMCNYVKWSRESVETINEFSWQH